MSLSNAHSLEQHIWNALRCFGLRRDDLRVCLLFGSQARGLSRQYSDVDLLLLIREIPELPSFSYKRCLSESVDVDCNLLKFSFQDSLFRHPRTHWAYRLHGAVPVLEFCNEEPSRILQWISKVNKIIESETACSYRANEHFKDLEVLVKLLKRCDGLLLYLQCYLVAELLGLIELILLNLTYEVPYSKSYPEEAVSGCIDKLKNSLARMCVRLWAETKTMRILTDPQPQPLSPPFIRKVRHEMHREVDKVWPDNLGLGYVGLLKRTWPEISKLDGYLSKCGTPQIVVPSVFNELLADLTGEIRLAIETKPHRTRSAPQSVRIRNEDKPVKISRLIKYDRRRKRLKGILPTGGCRLASCTFCMLPNLSLNKGDVKEFLNQMHYHIDGPLSKVAIYTDGSFFDNREVTNEERQLIAEGVSQWEARELLVETLPRFLTRQKVAHMVSNLSSHCRLRIGIGIQSMSESVRRFITCTPVTNGEFEDLFSLRREIEFSLRIFLLAGKPLLSRFEDIEDLRLSLKRLRDYLKPSDIVTINPLLPTEGTLVHSLHNEGFCEPLSSSDAHIIALELNKEDWPFILEWGPLRTNSCTNQVVNSSDMYEPPDERSGNMMRANERADNGKYLDHQIGPGLIPWGFLGDIKNRSCWAKTL